MLTPEGSTHSIFLLPKNATFPPVSGDAQRVLALARLGQKCGSRISLFYFGKGKQTMLEGIALYPISGEVTADPSISRRFSPAKSIRDLFYFTLTVASFVRRDRTRRVVIYAHTPLGGLVGLVVKFVTGFPLVYDPHDWYFEVWVSYHRNLSIATKNLISVGYRFLSFLLPLLSDCSVCVSQAMMEAMGTARRKVLIPNFLEELRLADISENIGRWSIVFAGHIAAYQGVLNLIRAFSIVERKTAGAELLIIGGGEDMQLARSLAIQLRVPNVRFMGPISHDYALGYVKKSTVCVAPFLALPFVATSCPIKLLEYMALNKFIVVTDLPVFRDLMRGYQNAIFSSPSYQGLAQALITALESSQSTGQGDSSYVNIEDLRKVAEESFCEMYERLRKQGL